MIDINGGDKVMRPMVFLNTAWMERYEGLSGNDSEIHGGGSYVEENGYGAEIFNFKKIAGKVFGYARSGGLNNLQRLGANEDDDFIEGVLIIFTAKHEDGGTYIVGWHEEAIFYKDYQETELKERKYKQEYIGYYTEAKAENVTLLNIDERFSFPMIPRRIKGGMGQSNIWYADSVSMAAFKQDVLKHIEKYEKVKKAMEQKSFARKVDIQANKIIEAIAIKEVSRKYTEREFMVSSVESENLGWDLEAVYKQVKLRIEVKGLSGNIISVEITPNEYKKMQEYIESYRLAIVTNCLVNPQLNIFSYSTEKNAWCNEEGDLLIIDQIIAARCYI